MHGQLGSAVLLDVDGCNVSSQTIVDDDPEIATICTKYRDMFRQLVREEFRHSLGGPNVDHGGGEIDGDVSENSVKDETYVGMFCIEMESFTKLEDPDCM